MNRQKLYIVICLFIWAIPLKVLSQNQPNILLVMAEDISNDLECYGMKGVKTPVFNKLADEGVMFTNCIGTNSICSPSRSALMLGVHQNISGTHNHRSNRKKALEATYKPITYWLEKAGYNTYLGNDLVYTKGKKIDCNFKAKGYGKYDGVDNFGIFNSKGKYVESTKPFFAQVQLKVTHRGNWWKSIREKSSSPVDPNTIVLPPFMADTQKIREDWATYLDQIEYADYEMGMLIEELKQANKYENTIIIFIGDNGRCNIRGKGYLYDSGLRIPLIVTGGAIEKGKLSDKLLTFSDISATILTLAKAEIPEYITGNSIFDTEERAYVYSARDRWDEVVDRSRAITTKKFKYIKNYFPSIPYDAHQAYLEYNRPALHVMRKLDEQGKLTAEQQYFFKDQKEEEELYDLENDPHELKNLVSDPKYTKQLNLMRDYMRAWQTTYDDKGFVKEKEVSGKGQQFIDFIKNDYPNVWSEIENGELVDLTEIKKSFNTK